MTTSSETGAGRGGRLFSTQVAVSETEIAAPHNFGFQLRHYVVAPEVREGEKLVEILRLSSGRLVKVDVVSRGRCTRPGWS